MSKDIRITLLMLLALSAVIFTLSALWGSRVASQQASSYYVVLYPDLGWRYTQCHEDNPFQATRPMQWDSERGLVEVNNSQGMHDELAYVVEVTGYRLPLQVIFEHNGEQWATGLQCPVTSDGYTDIHLWSPVWGALSED